MKKSNQILHASAFRYHATKIVDYALRSLVVFILVIPTLFWLSMSGGLGREPPEHGEKIFTVLLFVAIAPAHYALRLLEMLGVSSGFVGWMTGFIVVPLFWGAATYAFVQLWRRVFRVSLGA